VSASGQPNGGAVATSHHLATEAGADVLRAGGNAIDAAIAAAAVLCVVYPNNVALGGDLVALVRDPQGRTRFVNATGRAARGETLEALRASHGDALPDRGIDTVTVPGGVRGWESLAALGARLGWSRLLAPALSFARDGHPVARSVARAIVLERPALETDPGCRATFLPDGRARHEGELWRQPALAETLQALAEAGPEAFYVGPLAERWVGGLAALGSAITTADASSYRPTVEDPIRGRFGDLDVLTSPPNTQGFSLLRTLGALEAEAIADPLGAGAAVLAELFAANNRVRAAHLADPEASARDLDELLGAPAPAADQVDARAATGDTVGLVAVSEDGWAVSLVQSVYWAFGAAVLEPSTGVLFQNRGTSFSLDASHPAAFGGGRRPPHTLMPVLVERAGELAYAQATMGGQAQPQIHAQLLLRSIAGASPVEATSAPRWVVGAQDDGDTAATLTYETDVADGARNSLEATAFALKRVPPRDERLGHSNLIRASSSGLDAASDPRSDGSAVIVTA
jgi:gamma-glutamyltranspeptidase/glutathione hydrolase